MPDQPIFYFVLWLLMANGQIEVHPTRVDSYAECMARAAMSAEVVKASPDVLDWDAVCKPLDINPNAKRS